MDKPSCETCRFWGDPSVSSEDFGHCRRYPPIIIQRVTIDSDYDYDLMGWFPEVSPTSWCGEYQAKEGE